MAAHLITRRQFLVIAGGLAAGSILGNETSSAEFHQATQGQNQTFRIYRLSLRGRRGSQAALKHNANLRFLTKRAANRFRAHPGDNSRIVQLTVSHDEFIRLFVRQKNGRWNLVPVADLRNL